MERVSPWVVVERFEDIDLGVCVQVVVNRAGRRPIYALTVGAYVTPKDKPGQEGWFSPRIFLHFKNVSFGVLQLDRRIGGGVQALITKAENAAYELAAQEASDYVDQRVELDTRAAMGGQKLYRHTGKTEATRQKQRARSW